MSASRRSGSRYSRSRSGWAWSPASSCRSSLVPIGAATRMLLRTYCHRSLLMKASPRSFSRQGSWTFSPSFPYRLAHVVVGFFVTTGFAVLGVGAYLVRREPSAAEGRIMLSMTLWLLTVLVPLQISIGDLHGLNTREHQPAKLAAIEARWDTERRVPLTL